MQDQCLNCACTDDIVVFVMYCSAFMEYNTEQFTPAKVGEDLVSVPVQKYYHSLQSYYWSSCVYYTHHIVNFVLP